MKKIEFSTPSFISRAQIMEGITFEIIKAAVTLNELIRRKEKRIFLSSKCFIIMRGW